MSFNQFSMLYCGFGLSYLIVLFTQLCQSAYRTVYFKGDPYLSMRKSTADKAKRQDASLRRVIAETQHAVDFGVPRVVCSSLLTVIIVSVLTLKAFTWPLHISTLIYRIVNRNKENNP